MRYKNYILLAVVAILLQVLLLNNITISTLLAPMLYIVCIALMPIEWPPLRVLLAALAIALVMDFTMGTCGLNVIVTLPVALLRRPTMHYLAGISDISSDEGIPSAKRMGVRFHRYFVAIIVLHSLLFFSVESLSFTSFGLWLARFVCSTAATLTLAYLVVFLFETKLHSK